MADTGRTEKRQQLLRPATSTDGVTTYLGTQQVLAEEMAYSENF